MWDLPLLCFFFFWEAKPPRFRRRESMGDESAHQRREETCERLRDALAASGLRFTDWHAGASVCTPSRAALLTGRLGARTGVTHNFGIASTMGLDLDEKTIAEVVKPAGYDTKVRYALLLGVDARAFVVRASSFSPLRCAACGHCPRINHASLFTNACVRTNTFNQSHNR